MFYKRFVLCLMMLQTVNAHSQGKNLGDVFRLEKVITFKVPSRDHGIYSLCRFESGNVYILTENFITDKQSLLFRENLASGARDTFFLEAGLNEISDFNITGNELVLMIRGSFLCYDLSSRRYSRIYTPGVVGYQHFYPRNGHSVYLYEWQIGERYEERKDITMYDMESDSFSMLYPLTLTGINFMSIRRGYKYMDIKNSLVARGKASAYSIALRTIGSQARDTLRRDFKPAEFISESFIEKLHSGYSGKRMFSVFDSLDEHCRNRRLIRSLKLSSDTILYVHHQDKSPECKWWTGNGTGFLDVWKYDPNTGIWKLFLNDVRPDNRSVCAKTDWKHLKKHMIGFSMTGLESEWMVDGDMLLIPKLVSDKVDLDGDLSYLGSRKHRAGPQNLHIFVFRLK